MQQTLQSPWPAALILHQLNARTQLDRESSRKKTSRSLELERDEKTWDGGAEHRGQAGKMSKLEIVTEKMWI